MRWVDNVTLLLTPVKSTLIIFENLKIIFSLINMSIISPSSINLERNLLSATCKGFYDDNKRVYLKLMNVNVMFGNIYNVIRDKNGSFCPEGDIRCPRAQYRRYWPEGVLYLPSFITL